VSYNILSSSTADQRSTTVATGLAVRCRPGFRHTPALRAMGVNKLVKQPRLSDTWLADLLLERRDNLYCVRTVAVRAARGLRLCSLSMQTAYAAAPID